jgi:phosphopantothenoylcysteine decarboxylase / phosphopantothenate---cysteine ligase
MPAMRILITAGPTREPIDPVRYISNRSSGKLGAALAAAALRGGHIPTLIVGPVTEPMPGGVRRFDVETAAEMLDMTLRHWPGSDLLIMAAAVADYRPSKVHQEKLHRQGAMTIECTATEDIAAAVGRVKEPHQRTIGFSLESGGGVERAKQKLAAKGLDLIVYNPLATIDSPSIHAVLIFADGRQEPLPPVYKNEFADILIQRAAALWS